MDLPVLAAAALGLAAFSLSDSVAPTAASSRSADGPAALVGQTLYGSEDPLPRWGEPVEAEDLALEDLGTVSRVVTAPDGTPERLVVAVGGLWGLGAREVELGLTRVRLVEVEDGSDRLVVDLSPEGAAPVEG